MSRFDYIRYDEFSSQAQAELKKRFMDLEMDVNEFLPTGRAKSLIMTKLEEAYMWVGKGIRDAQIEREGKSELQEGRGNL